MTPTLLLLQGAAVVASLTHLLIDSWLGLFGSGDPISPGEALTLISVALVYGWWLSPIAAATNGVRGAMLALVILAGFWAGFANGLVGLAACFIPCAGAAPFQDIPHVASLVFGVWAAWVAWRAYRAMPGDTQLAPPVTAVVLVIASFAFQAASAAPR